jgi:hypothetical protein
MTAAEAYQRGTAAAQAAGVPITPTNPATTDVPVEPANAIDTP